MNIRELAKRANVSTATVSRVINRVPTVNRPMAKRVWRAVEDLGYCPNSQARSLVSGRSHVLGLIISDLIDPFFSEVVRCFEEIAVQHSYEILLSSAVHDSRWTGISVRRMLERRVDGVAILTFNREDDIAEVLRCHSLPVVCTAAGPEIPASARINIDYLHGIRQAVQHFAAFRHRRIAFLMEDPPHQPAIARKKAFDEAMNEIGLEVVPELSVLAPPTVEGSMRALMQLMRLSRPPTAILCFSDMAAVGVIQRASECEINVPRDLSVVGFGDIPMSQFMTPALSTIQLSQQKLATLAFQALMTELHSTKSEPEKPCEFKLQTELVTRSSTSFAPVNS